MGFVNSDKAFVSSARLYTIVPETSDSSFSEVLSNAEQDDESEHSSLLPVKERRLLFFGMFSVKLILCTTSYLFTDMQMKR